MGRSEQVIAQRQRGLDAGELEAGLRLAQPPDEVIGREVEALGQGAGGQAQGEWQVGAEAGNDGGGGGQSRRNLNQQLHRIVVGQRFQVGGVQAGQGKTLARGDEHEAGRRGRQKRLHLRRVAGIVHQDQGALAVQHREVEATQAGVVWQFGSGMIGADDVGHRLGRGEGAFAHAPEVEEELGVGVLRGKTGGEFEGQRRLANAALPAQAGDDDVAGLDIVEQCGEFGLAPHKIGRGRR